MHFIYTSEFYTLILSNGDGVLQYYKELWVFPYHYYQFSLSTSSYFNSNYVWFIPGSDYSNFPEFKTPNIGFIHNRVNLEPFFQNHDIRSVIGVRPNLYYLNLNIQVYTCLGFLIGLFVYACNEAIPLVNKCLLSIRNGYDVFKNSLLCSKGVRSNKFNFIDSIPRHLRDVTVYSSRNILTITEELRNERVSRILADRRSLLNRMRSSSNAIHVNVTALSRLLADNNLTLHASEVQSESGERGLAVQHAASLHASRANFFRAQVATLDNSIRRSYDTLVRNNNLITDLDISLVRLGVDVGEGSNVTRINTLAYEAMLLFNSLINLD